MVISINLMMGVHRRPSKKNATYNLKLIGEKIFVNPTPNPEGTYVEPVRIFDVTKTLP